VAIVLDDDQGTWRQMSESLNGAHRQVRAVRRIDEHELPR
jgi:hypothetical protein